MNSSPHDLTCQRCGQILTGQYIQALGSDWHPDCWRCEGCGKSIKGSFIPQDGRPYHAACHDERFGLRCTFCHGLILGKYFTHEGMPVCEKDYLARIAARCFFCDQVLPGTYMGNAFGQRACKRHDHGPCCSSCDRWLGPEERRQPAKSDFGTVLCHTCRIHAVWTEEAQGYGNLFGSAALRELGLELKLVIPVPIRLESVARIRKLKGPHQQRPDGITQTRVETINDRESARMVREIIVVGGLALEHFEGVLAHEFGHVWLFHGKLDHLSDLQAEGFCELVKYRWLAKLGTPLAYEIQRKMENNPDPVYGNGFRLLKGQWDRDGISGVLGLLAR